MDKQRKGYISGAKMTDGAYNLHSVIGKPQCITNPEWTRKQYTDKVRARNGFYAYFFGIPTIPENWKHFWCFMIRHHTGAEPLEVLE